MTIRIERAEELDHLAFAKNGGTVTVVVQDDASGAVLMVAAADREAMARTIATGEMHFTSRTRGLWHKGATSGNVQRVRAMFADCDGDAVLAFVAPAGPACHTGATSCFGDSGDAQAPCDALHTLDAVVAQLGGASSERHPASYTQRLLADRNLRLKKLGEESVELALACASGDRAAVVSEAADLLYHMVVALHGAGVRLPEVNAELAQRRSG